MQSERINQIFSSRPDRFPMTGRHEDGLRTFLTARFGRDMSDFPMDACLVDGMGLDSLDEFELMAAVETEFHVTFSPEHFDQPKTIRCILEALSTLDARVAQ